MAPQGGQQPRFIVTIQPHDVRFDPPAAITFVNDDGLPPGAITEIYSFDHDLAEFVSVGTGTVSDDGRYVTSDPGFGIVEGGWHCQGPTNPTGFAEPAVVSLTDATPLVLCLGDPELDSATLTAIGTPQPPCPTVPPGFEPDGFTWSYPAFVTLTGQGGDTVTIDATAPGEGSIAVDYSCESCETSDPQTVDITVLQVEITDEHDTVLVSPDGAERVAVKTELRARVTPGVIGASYRWLIDDTVAIRSYTHAIDDPSQHGPIGLVLDQPEVDFFWTEPGVHTVTLQVTYRGVTCSTSVDFDVVHEPDPNRDVYTMDDDPDRTPNGLTDTYAVKQGHADWHTAKGMPPVTFACPDSCGADYLSFHHDLLQSHLAWRGTFNLPPLAPPPTQIPPRPDFLERSPPPDSTEESTFYRFVRLCEFQDLDQLGQEVYPSWDVPSQLALGPSYPDIADPFAAPAIEDDLFWRYRAELDRARADWIAFCPEQAMVEDRTPDQGDTADGPLTEIVVVFDKRVSFDGPPENLVQVTADKLTVNGSAATSVTETLGPGTDHFRTFTFTGFTTVCASPPCGPPIDVEVVLTGTGPFGYSGDTWTFQVQ